MNNKQHSAPSIAVVLAAYNGTTWIADQIDSILKQQGVAIQLFISVDASADGTEAIVDAWGQQDTRIHVLRHGQRFGSAGKNFYRLLREVNFIPFEYIAFADQDDIWLPTKLQSGCAMMLKMSVDGYSSNALAFWPDGSQRLIDKAQPQVLWDYMFESAGPGCTFILTKKLALAAQAFLMEHQESCKPIELHDWFIYAFARSRGYRWVIDRSSYLHYRQHPFNLVGANVGFKAIIFRVRKMCDGWLFKQALLIADTLGYQAVEPMLRLRRHTLLDRLYLVSRMSQLRRRFRDRLALAFFILFFSSKK